MVVLETSLLVYGVVQQRIVVYSPSVDDDSFCMLQYLVCAVGITQSLRTIVIH